MYRVGTSLLGRWEPLKLGWRVCFQIRQVTTPPWTPEGCTSAANSRAVPISTRANSQSAPSSSSGASVISSIPDHGAATAMSSEHADAGDARSGSSYPSSSCSSSSSYSWWERVGEVATQMLVDLARDKGRLLMNVGAVTSLAGFMMSDVLQLRMLNVTGTLCGMAYNCTRQPAQWNAVAWGVVFGGVNVAMIFKLLQERTIAVTFTIDEMDLYHMHFEETEVTPQQFKQLIDKGTWQDARQGEVIVCNGRPLGSVILFHKGRADAVGSDGTILYTYGGGRSTGCVVGGTALVDSEVLTKAYPNKVVAADGVRYIFWDTNLLLQLMKDNKAIHSAIMQLLYGTLINTLRADRLAEKQRQKEIKRESSEQIIKQYTLLLKGVIADEKVGPKEKECVLEFAREHNITNTQHLHLLQKLGWSEHEWDQGKKQNRDEDGV